MERPGYQRVYTYGPPLPKPIHKSLQLMTFSSQPTLGVSWNPATTEKWSRGGIASACDNAKVLLPCTWVHHALNLAYYTRSLIICQCISRSW